MTTATVIEELPSTTANDLQQVLTAHARRAERSLQIEAGPSELGQECRRRVAHLLTGSPRPNISRDEWTAAVGTACHAWVEGAFAADNERRMAEGKPPRWLIETPIEIRPGLIGHCDLFDLENLEVIDHKFPGVTAIRKYKRKGDPGQQYRWQAHLYGLGWERLGFEPRNVSLVMYPRSGLLRDTWKWTAPYDRSIAEEALAAADTILADANISDLAGFMGAYFMSLKRDTDNCAWCPYFDRLAEDPTTGCRGAFYDPEYAANPPIHEMAIPGIL
jgi:hypothetical protein